jgi:hypothetical protein
MSAYLGKPAVVDGECSVDITSTVQYLPSGSYIAVISAVSDGGWGTSAPSPVFSF